MPVPVSSAVKVKSGLPAPRAEEKLNRYWIGTTPDCPIQNVTVGGICFPRFSGTPTFDDSAVPDRKLDMGQHANLSAAHVKFIQKHVSVRVIRILGREPEPGIDDSDRTPSKKRRGVLYVTGGKDSKIDPSRGYVHRVGDIPLGHFLYMHRMDRMAAEDLTTFPPETMEDEE